MRFIRDSLTIALLVVLAACSSLGVRSGPIVSISPSPSPAVSASPSPDDASEMPTLPQGQIEVIMPPMPAQDAENSEAAPAQVEAREPNAPVALTVAPPAAAPANLAQPALPASELPPGTKIPASIAFYHTEGETSAVPTATKAPIVSCSGTSRAQGFKGTCMMNLSAGCVGFVSMIGFQGECSSSKVSGLCLSPTFAPGLLIGGSCIPATGTTPIFSATASPSPSPALALGETGNWNDPIPFGSDTAEFTPGTIIWVPVLQKYFVMRDDCAACDDVWKNQQRYEVALSSGSVSDSSVYSAQNCEAALQTEITGSDRMLPIVVAPPSDEPVNHQPIFNAADNLCFDQTAYPNQPQAVAPPVAAQTPPPAPIPVANRQFIGFWQSWSDRSDSVPFARLSSIPSAVTVVDVAFSEADGNTVLPPQNTDPIDASAIHARGGKVLLAIGGSQSSFDITDPSAFVTNLGTFLETNAGVYDGVDFNDERIPAHGARRLAAVIAAVRARFPSPFIITYDAFLSGADPQTREGGHDGEDRELLQAIGSQIDWVNVMDYDQYDWRPSDHPRCAFVPSANDDCYRDVLEDFAALIPPSKVVMGLMIPRADDGAGLSPADAAAYAGWVKNNGYAGIMIWNVNRDTAQGDYMQAIGGAL